MIYFVTYLFIYWSYCDFLLKLPNACRISDFEFTPECAIFDLLDIPLYHGWIVDSQVWSLSYQILLGTSNIELVTLFLLQKF